MRRNEKAAFRASAALQGMFGALGVVLSKPARALSNNAFARVVYALCRFIALRMLFPPVNAIRRAWRYARKREALVWLFAWAACAILGVGAFIGSSLAIKLCAGSIFMLGLAVTIMCRPLTGLLIYILFAPLLDIVIRNNSASLTGQNFVVILLVLVFVLQMRRDLDWRPTPLLHVTMFLFLGVLLIETMRATDVKSALAIVITGFVLPISAYFLGRRWISDEKTLSNVLTCLVIAGTYFALMGIPEHFLGHTIFRPTIWVEQDLGTVRVQGPASSPTEFGMAVGFGVLIALARFSVEPLKTRKFWYGVAVLISLVGIALTLRRSVYVGLTLGLLTLLACSERIRRFIMRLLVIGLLIAAVGIGPLMHSRYYTDRIGDPAPLLSREIMQSTAIEMFRAHPIAGVGTGNFAEYIPRYFKSYQKFLVYHAYGLGSPHNEFLRIASEGGLVTLIPFLAMLLLIFMTTMSAYRNTKKRGLDGRDGIILYWAMSILFVSQFLQSDALRESPYAGAVWFMLTGAILGVHLKKKRPESGTNASE